MRLEAVSLALPSRRMSNDDVLALVQRHSEPIYEGDLSNLLRRIQYLLCYSGAEQRFWLGHDERPTELVARAVEDALVQAGCTAADIDLLIYAGVDRGFVEPATAYFLAKLLGMERVQCFDILDACNGWSRAMHLIQALLQTGAYRRAMVINAEFPMFGGGPVYPKLFSLEHARQLASTFAGYTLGEGVTATIVAADSENPWEFHFSSQPSLADYCTLPLRGYERFGEPSEHIGRNGIDHFSADGSVLSAHAGGEIISLLKQLSVPMDRIAAIFPHASSRRDWEQCAASIGVGHLLYYIYPRCGNLISASIPAGIALAAQEGRIHRGDRILGCVASAGMSYAVYSFVY